MPSQQVKSTVEPRRGSMGLWTTSALVVGNMVGSGVFLLPAALAAYGGISLLAWLITAGGAMVCALTFAHLSRKVPRQGGPYIYTRVGFGDFTGFLMAWGYWISIWTTNAALAVALVSYLTVFWGALADNAVLAAATAVGFIWILTAVNIMGIRQVGAVQVVTTVLKMTPLIAVACLGLVHVQLEHFVPFNLSGQSNGAAITACVALTLWAFLGFESATIPAEHIRRPAFTIARATIIGTSVTAVVYILGTVAVMGVLPPARLAASTAPFADAASAMWGSWAGYAVAAGAVISCLGALNGWVLLQAQLPLAVARDRLFPSVFARLSRRGIPVVGLLISSSLSTILVTMNFTKGLVEQFTFIILLATLTALVPYVFTTMSALILMGRERRLRGEPLPRVAFTVAALAFAYSLWAIAGAGPEVVYWGFLLLLAGIPVYVWMTWRGEPSDGSASTGSSS